MAAAKAVGTTLFHFSTQAQSHGQPEDQSGLGNVAVGVARANRFSWTHSAWPSLKDWLWPAGVLARSEFGGPLMP